jgi:hypothetical protein
VDEAAIAEEGSAFGSGDDVAERRDAVLPGHDFLQNHKGHKEHKEDNEHLP